MTDTEKINSLTRKQRLLNITWFNYQEREKELFRVRVHESKDEAARDFCNKNFVDEWIWSRPVHVDYADMLFLHEADALLFKLSFDTIPIK